MVARAPADVRVAVPHHTSREAAVYRGGPLRPFAAWVQGYEHSFPDRPAVTGAPLITGLAPESRGGTSIPFGGPAEGMFLSALRWAGVPLQQIRPAPELVRIRLGVEHALASEPLHVTGTPLLREVSAAVDDDTRHTTQDLVVHRDGQYVFRQVIEQYLRRTSYEGDEARSLVLPRS